MKSNYALIAAAIAITLTGSLLAQGPPINGTADVSLEFAGTPRVGEQVTGTLVVDLGGVTGQNGSGSTPAVLGGYQITVAFDTTRLQFVSATGGSSSGFNSTPTYTDPGAANAAGQVTLAASHTASNSPTGRVTVATLRFTTILAGDAPVTPIPESLSSAFQSPSYGPTTLSAAGSPATVTILAPVVPPGAFSYVSPANGTQDVPRPVSLQWTFSSDATHFEVYFGETSNPPLTDVVSGLSTVPETSTGTTYYWRISAVNRAGRQDGPVWSFETEGPTCPAPAEPVLTAPAKASSKESYVVSWPAVAGADVYVIEESTAASFANPVSSTIAAPASSATFTHEVANATTYYYRASARRTSGGCDISSSYSAAKSVIVDPSVAPPPPPPPPPPASTTNVVPVVGSLPGGFGSYFRTTVQLHNPTDAAQTGKLVYRPREGTAPSTLDYALAPHQTMRYTDVVASMNLTGMGSLDVVPSSGSFPVVMSRIFNDAGDAGTSGMTMDQLDPANALQPGQTGLIVGPTDQTKSRLNLGVRTLETATVLSFAVRNSSGQNAGSVSKSFGTNAFIQQSSKEFLGFDIPDDAVIEVTVTSGSAIVYATITDTKTNDPSYQNARRIR